MRILHIIPNLNKGGAQRLAINIVKGLQENCNSEVQLITFCDQNDFTFLSNSINWLIIPSKVIPSIFGKSLVDVSQLQCHINTFQPDIIHSHLFETEMILAHIILPKKTKRIIHFHNNMHQFKHLSFKKIIFKSNIINFYEKYLVLKSYPDKAISIAISKNTFDFCKSVLPKKIKVELIHNAIDLNVFTKINKMIKTNKLTLIGGLWENKGHILAFQTIYELKKRGLKVKLYCLGEGIERKKLEKFIFDHNLINEVKLLGNQDYPESFLQSSFCCFSTSKSEAFGLTIIEAMACGLPVVSTDGKGNRDLIHEGENGFMVLERDPKLLADKIEILLKNELLRLEMGEKAAVFAQEFGIEEYLKKLVAVYIENSHTK
jgi:glycosyltransferase EpsD